jgi:hypothetical protein
MKPTNLREQLAEIHQAVADEILDGLQNAEDPKSPADLRPAWPSSC